MVYVFFVFCPSMRRLISRSQLVKFLETRERGALFINVAFRMRQYPQEPALDWLTFGNLQGTMDKTLQESAAFYDPAASVTVFVYLPSQSGNSVAIWRRKINVPEKARNQYRAELHALVKTLPEHKAYIVMVDESVIFRKISSIKILNHFQASKT